MNNYIIYLKDDYSQISMEQAKITGAFLKEIRCHIRPVCL